jgi:endonuclease/exonuclease/phosphatase family metal-dependent hydrolase
VFIATHLDHTSDPAVRIGQTILLNALATGYDPHLQILAGDLNAEPGSEPMLMLARQFKDTSPFRSEPTFPSRNPERRIDYVLARPASSWRVVEVRVLAEEIASDHRPVLVILEAGGWR